MKLPAFVLLLILAAIFASRVEAATGAARPQKLFFESAGHRIRADFYPPTSVARGRTVIVLYGAGGILFDGPRVRRVARALNAAGDGVYLLHYFDRTGTIATRDAEMQARFDDWLATVRDGISWVHGREGKRPVGVYGYSLGGFLAVAAASDNRLIGSVAEQAGGIWNLQEKRIGKMPPVFVVHGREDERVPFEKYARSLLRVLHARGGEVQTDFVPGEAHIFTESAMKLVRPKIVSFFARTLAPR